MDNHIIVMMKFPRAGEVNTRMIPDIGAKKAALVHQRMAEHTIEKTNVFSDAQTIVHITNCSDAEASQWLGDTEYSFQKGNDLGERMANAVDQSIKQNAGKILIVGTDCLDLNTGVFEQAFAGLDNDDVVYAPAHDGGYVLVGMKSLHLSAFQNIDWGTKNVLAQSLQQLQRNSISYHLLGDMHDVDFAQDIPQKFLS